MAHGCINCGAECYCNGDIDDTVTTLTPNNCTGCGCEDDDDYDIDDNDFTSCSNCDGHPACEDFGCYDELFGGNGHPFIILSESELKRLQDGFNEKNVSDETSIS